MKKMNSYSLPVMFLGLVALGGCGVPDSTLASSSSDEEMAIVISSDSPDGKVTIDAEALALVEGAVRLKIERAAGEASFSIADADDWQQVAPGVWEYTVDGTSQQLVVGEEGHRWLAEHTELEIEKLYAEAEAEGWVNPEIRQRIDNLEQSLGDMLGVMRAAPESSPLAVSCNYTLYAGASSAVTNPPVAGAAALADISCSGGCLQFTTTTQACCSGICSAVNTQTMLVCGSARMGIAKPGSGFGMASVNLNPPNITFSNTTFFCQ